MFIRENETDKSISPFRLPRELELSIVWVADIKSLHRLSITCAYFSWLRDYIKQFHQFEELELLQDNLPLYLETLQAMQEKRILSVNFRIQHDANDNITLFDRACYYFSVYYDNATLEEELILTSLERLDLMVPLVHADEDMLSRCLHHLLNGVLHVLQENENDEDDIEFKTLRENSLLLFEKLLQKGANPNYFVNNVSCLHLISTFFFLDKECKFIKLMFKYGGNPHAIGIKARGDNFFSRINDLSMIDENSENYRSMRQLSILYNEAVKTEYERTKLAKSNQRLTFFYEKLIFSHANKRILENGPQQPIGSLAKKRRNSM